MSNGKFLKGDCQQCGGHIEFPAEAVGTMIDCPHCGKQTELLLAVPPIESSLPTKAIVYTIVAIVILVGGLVCAQIALKRARRLVDQKNEATPPPASKPATPPGTVLTNGFRVSTITLEKTSGSSLIYAAGTIRNESARKRFGVKAEFDLFDDAGKKVGTAKDYQQSLEPKTDWSFRALVVGPNVASAKLASITEDQ